MKGEEGIEARGCLTRLWMKSTLFLTVFTRSRQSFYDPTRHQMGKGIASLGSLAEQELCYHYDIIDVAGEEDAQLHETIQNLSDKVILSKSTE